MKKPFFFRIEAGALLDFATDPEGEGITLLRFAKDLQKGESDIPFIQQLIDEAKGFIQKKASAGKKGMKNRWLQKNEVDNSVITVLSSVITNDNTVITNDNTVITNDNTVITNDNTPITSSSSSSSSSSSNSSSKDKIKGVCAASDKPMRASAQKMTDDEWILMLKKNDAYAGIDVDRERAKMEAWCITNKRQPTRKRFLNWLNRVDKPMAPNGPQPVLSSKGAAGALARVEELRRQRLEKEAKNVQPPK